MQNLNDHLIMATIICKIALKETRVNAPKIVKKTSLLHGSSYFSNNVTAYIEKPIINNRAVSFRMRTTVDNY